LGEALSAATRVVVDSRRLWMSAEFGLVSGSELARVRVHVLVIKLEPPELP